MIMYPGGSDGKESDCNAGDVGSIPGQGTKIPYDLGQLSPCATKTWVPYSSYSATREATTTREKLLHTATRDSWVQQQRPNAAKNEWMNE